MVVIAAWWKKTRWAEAQADGRLPCSQDGETNPEVRRSEKPGRPPGAEVSEGLGSDAALAAAESPPARGWPRWETRPEQRLQVGA